MTISAKCANFDGYLLAASYGLSSGANNLMGSSPNSMNPGYEKPLWVMLANIPAVLISVTGAAACTAKLALQIIGKGAFSVAGACGNTKAREWSLSINLSLTARKTSVFVLGSIIHTIGLVPFVGILTHWLNMRLVEKFGMIETSLYIQEKLQKDPSVAHLELNTEDITNIAKRAFVQEGAGMLCIFGFANHAIQASANNLGFFANEEHNPTPCNSRIFTPYYKTDYYSGDCSEKLCSCGLANAEFAEVRRGTWKGITEQGYSKYTWKLHKKQL